MENGKKSNPLKTLLIQNNTYLIFLALFFACTLLSSNFLTSMNIRNIALQQAAPILVAIGMLFVVLTGGIDLSVGSVMAFGSSLSSILVTHFGVNFILAIFIALVAGFLFGVLTGSLVAYAGMQGFVASLATMTIARGGALMLTNGQPIKIPQGTISLLVDRSHLFPILIITGLIIILFVLVQRYTAFGRIVIAIGSNSSAVELAGIRVKRYTMSVYAISGVLAALAGVYICARASTGSATIGNGQELDAIAACVIGGASLAGGRGWVFKTVIGALVLALIGNIMNLTAVPPYPQDIIKGIIIILAVLLQIFTSRSDRSH